MGGRPRATGHRVVDLLDLADRTVNACLARVTAASNLSREQWRTLMLLDEGVGEDGLDAPGHSMGEIAVRAAVPAPTATRVVDRLIAEGFAFRRSDDWDRRRVLVHISAAGHRVVASAAADLDEAFGTVLADLGTADRIDLIGLLTRLESAIGGEERVRTP